jgi:hypothetical protein
VDRTLRPRDERKPNGQPGIPYNDLVNTIHAQIPPGVKVISAKANAISTSGTRQQLTLVRREISAIDRVGERAQSRSASPTRDPWRRLQHILSRRRDGLQQGIHGRGARFSMTRSRSLATASVPTRRSIFAHSRPKSGST